MPLINNVLVVLYAICLTSSSLTFAQKAPLKSNNEPLIISVGEFPPYISEQMPTLGVLCDIVKTTLEDIGYQVQFEFSPWARVKKNIINQTVDGSISWEPSPTLDRHVLFSQYYIAGENAFFALKDSKFSYQHFDDLKQFILGINIGFEFGEEFSKRKNELNIVDIPEGESGVRLVIKKRVDAYLNDRLVVQHEMQKYIPKAIKRFKQSKTFHIYKYRLLNLTKRREDSEAIMKAFDKAVEKRLSTKGYESTKIWDFQIKNSE